MAVSDRLYFTADSFKRRNRQWFSACTNFLSRVEDGAEQDERWAFCRTEKSEYQE